MKNNDDPEIPDQTEAQYPSPGTIPDHLHEIVGKPSVKRSSNLRSPTILLHSGVAKTGGNPWIAILNGCNSGNLARRNAAFSGNALAVTQRLAARNQFAF